jgi:type I restriction enzyme S subunit
MEHLDEFRGILREPAQVPYAQCRTGKSRFLDGDVVFAKITPCVQNGKCALVSGLDRETGFGSSEFYVLRASRRLLPEYLFFFLRQNQVIEAAVESFTGTSGRQRVPREFWDALEIPLPPLPVQECIVEILQRADAIRGKRQEIRNLFDSLASALFDQFFGDPERRNQWSTTTVGSVLSEPLANGKSPAKSRHMCQAEVLTLSSVRGGRLNSTERKLAGFDVRDVSRFYIRSGDMFVVRGNGNIDLLGRMGLYHGEDAEIVYPDTLIRIRFDESAVVPEFMQYLWDTQHIRRQIVRKAKTTSGTHKINQGDVQAFEFPCPPFPLQQEFLRTAKVYLHLLSEHGDSSDLADQTFHSLLSRAFTGDLTAEWEATRRQTIAAEQALHARLPQLVLLGFLREHAKRSAAAAGLWLTGLMKYAFLLQMEGAAKAHLYHFVPYHYGPFARDVYTDLEALRDQGLIAVEPHGEENPAYGADDGGLLRVAEAIAPYGSTKARKVETPRMDITIADTKAVDRTLQDLPVDLREDIGAILDAYGHLAHNALLKAVYEKYPAFAKKSNKLRGTRNKRKRGGRAAQQQHAADGAPRRR